MSSKPRSANSLGGLVLGVLPEIAQLQSLSDSHERKEKAMRLKICILAVYVLAMSTSSFGDVLVSNFFDDNSSDRGSIDTGLTQFEINCVDFLNNDGNPCDSDEDKKAMKFTVGGEYASAFSGVQIELDSESSFSKVKVRLDKGELEGRIATLSYAGGGGTVRAVLRRRDRAAESAPRTVLPDAVVGDFEGLNSDGPSPIR